MYAFIRSLELSARRSLEPAELASSGSGRRRRLEEIADVQLLVLALKRAQNDRRSAVPRTDLEQVPTSIAARLHLAEPAEQRRVDAIKEARHVFPAVRLCRGSAQVQRLRRLVDGLI